MRQDEHSLQVLICSRRVKVQRSSKYFNIITVSTTSGFDTTILCLIVDEIHEYTGEFHIHQLRAFMTDKLLLLDFMEDFTEPLNFLR